MESVPCETTGARKAIRGRCHRYGRMSRTAEAKIRRQTSRVGSTPAFARSAIAVALVPTRPCQAYPHNAMPHSMTGTSQPSDDPLGSFTASARLAPPLANRALTRP